MDPSAAHLGRDVALPEPCNGSCPKQACKYKGWRKIVLNFTPSWFSVTMGTGVVSILLHNLHYNAIWLYWISIGFFGLNVVLFILFSVISCLRYMMFKGVWSAMIGHPVQSLFLGTLSTELLCYLSMVL